MKRGRPAGKQRIYSSSSSPPTVASCLSWYSVIKSRTFLSASWNSISSIPSPLYQWRKAFLLYMAPNWVASLWKIPFKAVVLATKVADISLVFGEVVMIPDLRLFGIHSTKSSAFLVFNFSMLSSTSWVLRFPRKVKLAAMYFPSSGLTLEKKFLAEYAWLVSPRMFKPVMAPAFLLRSGAWEMRKKWSRGNGTKLTPSFRRSPFSLPGNPSDAVTPAMTQEIRKFRSA